jgi:hypothetical protein
MRSIEVFLPFLPGRAISPNRRVFHLERSDATLELRAGTTAHLLSYEAVSGLTEPFARARVNVTWHLTKQRPSITKCPRCLQWALEHQRSKKDRCRCYRPEDGGNAISALKPFFDGIKDAGIIPDDDFDHMEVGRVARQLVGALSEEGPWVEIEELP